MKSSIYKQNDDFILSKLKYVCVHLIVACFSFISLETTHIQSHTCKGSKTILKQFLSNRMLPWIHNSCKGSISDGELLMIQFSTTQLGLQVLKLTLRDELVMKKCHLNNSLK